MSNFDQIQHDVQEIEIDIQKAKNDIELGDALKRLISNKDFDLLISENYFKGEAERVVGAKADAAMIMNEVV